MASQLAVSRGGVGPPLWRNEKYGWDATDPDGAFQPADVEIYLDRIATADTPSVRVELTGLSDGVTVTSTTISVDMDTDWVADNMTAGKWRAAVLVGGYRVGWWTFDVLVPDAGAYTPGGGSSV